MSRAGWAALLIGLLPALALAQDPRPSEDDLFGDAPAEEPMQPPEEPPPPADPEPTDESGRLTGAVTQEQASARLAEAYDRLAVGGLLYLRGQYTLLDHGPAEEMPYSSPNLLDVYLDARPNDEVRGFARFRLQYDPSIVQGSVDRFGNEQDPTRFIVDQLWMKFDVARKLYVTVGKQRIKWGAGRFWNPTDFLNQQRLDPLAVLDLRTGVYLIKLHFPVESLGWNFYAVGNLDGAASPQEIGLALRGEVVVGLTEFALTAGVRQERSFGAGSDVEPAEVDDPPPVVRLGADVSSALGPFDVRAEVALLHNLQRPFYRVPFDHRAYFDAYVEERLPPIVADPGCGDGDCPELAALQAGLAQDPFAPLRYTRRRDFVPQLVLGADLPVVIGDQDSITFGAEYFFNDAGYDDESIYEVLLAERTFEPLYVGRHYLAVYAVLASPGSWDTTSFLLSTIANLSDGSQVARFDYRVSLHQRIRLDAHVAGFFGQGELRLAVNQPPILSPEQLASVPESVRSQLPPELTRRIFQPAPDAEVGVGLAVDF